MTDAVVVGAAIIRSGRIFLARRSQPQTVAGSWELPGGEVLAGEAEETALERLFTTEFGISLRCVDHILGDRHLTAWPTEDGDYSGAALRVWRCQLPSEATLDLDRGEPRPNMHVYDDSGWVDVADLDAVSPWREADRITASEIADYYRADGVWQSAD